MTRMPLLELSPTKQFELMRQLTGTHGLYAVTLFHNFYNDLKSLQWMELSPW